MATDGGDGRDLKIAEIDGASLGFQRRGDFGRLAGDAFVERINPEPKVILQYRVERRPQSLLFLTVGQL